MKKEDVLGVIVYLLILLVAVVFGITVLQEHSPNSGMDTIQYVGFVFAAIVSGVIFNAIIYELAHMLGAKVGRYEIVSVNILGFCWAKNEAGKFKFKFKSFDGLTGETKIVPKKDVKKEPNPSPYLLFGTLFFAIEIIALVVVFVSARLHADNLVFLNMGYFAIIVGVMGGIILIYNILPFHLDSMTDGYRLTMISNPKNKEAFNELLRVEYEIANGHDDVEIKVFDNITNFTADLNLNKVYALLDKKQFKEAEELLDAIIKNKENVSEKVYIRARAQKIYINIMTKDFEEAKKYYEEDVKPEERRKISRDISMASIRTYLLMSALFDKSRSESIIALNSVYKAYKATPDKRKPIEVELFNDALQRVVEAHPDWELENYKLISKDTKKEKNKEEK